MKNKKLINYDPEKDCDPNSGVHPVIEGIGLITVTKLIYEVHTMRRLKHKLGVWIKEMEYHTCRPPSMDREITIHALSKELGALRDKMLEHSDCMIQLVHELEELRDCGMNLEVFHIEEETIAKIAT